MISAIFRADDIGISRTTVVAARIAVERGVCRNVSVQAVGPHLAMVRDLIVPLQRSGLIRIGLHVTLCCEWDTPRFRPVGRHPHPSLLDEDGAFVHHPGILDQCRLPAEAVLDEATAQLTRLRDHGIAPDYIDEHMCFGWIRSCAEAIPALSRREGLLDADRIHFAHPPSHPRQAGPVEDMLAQLAAARGGPLRFVGHPLLPDTENAAFRLHGDPSHAINADRDAQRQMFTDPRIVAMVGSGRVASLRYDQLL